MFTNQEEDYSFYFKVLLLGDSTVGKTCYLKRFTENTYIDSHLATIGIDTGVKFLTLEDKDTKEKKVIKFQIVDTAGEEKYKAITSSYFKQANGILLLFDVTKRQTFNNIKEWVNQIKEKVNKNIVIYIVGNKIDLRVKQDSNEIISNEEGKEKDSNKIISTEEGKEMAKNLGYEYREGSAKENIGIEDIFYDICKDVYENEKNETRPEAGEQLTISQKKSTKKNKCC